MKRQILTLLIGTLFIISCKKEAQKSEANTTETQEVSLLDTLTLKLNSGEKWNVNNETHVGITKMDSLIKVFKSNKTCDYLALGESLSKQTSFVIKNCSMKGESHDQLHVVLVPMLDEISILRESENKKDLEQAFQKLESLIANYFKHFKINTDS